MKTAKIRVDITNIMLQAAQEMRSPVSTMGFQLAQNCLIKIAQRAIDLKDEELLDLCDTMCLIKQEDSP